jgi:hypothetical protein
VFWDINKSTLIWNLFLLSFSQIMFRRKSSYLTKSKGNGGKWGYNNWRNAYSSASGGGNAIPPPTLKEVGSQMANPSGQGSGNSAGPTPSSTSENSQGENAGGGSYTYKYKYKYPKRKRGDDSLENIAIQQKAEPGEQYRGGAAMRIPPYKKAKVDSDYLIEPRTTPGDQYETSASIRTQGRVNLKKKKNAKGGGSGVGGVEDIMKEMVSDSKDYEDDTSTSEAARYNSVLLEANSYVGYLSTLASFPSIPQPLRFALASLSKELMGLQTGAIAAPLAGKAIQLAALKANDEWEKYNSGESKLSEILPPKVWQYIPASIEGALDTISPMLMDLPQGYVPKLDQNGEQRDSLIPDVITNAINAVAGAAGGAKGLQEYGTEKASNMYDAAQAWISSGGGGSLNLLGLGEEGGGSFLDSATAAVTSGINSYFAGPSATPSTGGLRGVPSANGQVHRKHKPVFTNSAGPGQGLKGEQIPSEGPNVDAPEGTSQQSRPEEEAEPGYEGDQPAGPYTGYEKAAPGGDPNRTDPITPATGSKQTPASANSIVSVRQLKAAAESTARRFGPQAVHGTAEERANMGKGALDSYEFQGPYDYPIYPGGRPDDTLTMMGAWRTEKGNDSSLWYSKKTAKGADAKRNKYYKWSTKGGGKWRKMTKDQMVNVFQKSTANDQRFYGVRAGVRFTDFQVKSMSNRDKNIELAKRGNEIMVNREHSDYRPKTGTSVLNAPVPTSQSDAPSVRQNVMGNMEQTSKQGSSNQGVR